MPGKLEESAAIFRWLSEELASDTFVNIMGQYRPEYEVGEITHRGDKKYDEIDRRPKQIELCRAQEAARDAGLWRFDERWLR
jgi:putative pyruvate formate lyase activating enzyme